MRVSEPFLSRQGAVIFATVGITLYMMLIGSDYGRHLPHHQPIVGTGTDIGATVLRTDELGTFEVIARRHHLVPVGAENNFCAERCELMLQFVCYEEYASGYDLACFLAACEQNTPTAVSTPAPTNTASTNPTAAEPTTTPKPSPTPEPTPIIPAIDVSDQTLADEGTLTIDRVTVPDPAWLVIHALNEGQVGEVLGYTAVSAGTNEELAITINPLQATPQLVAMLHVDEGEPGTYEFPGPDNPWLAEGEAVAADFDVDIQAVVHHRCRPGIAG